MSELKEIREIIVVNIKEVVGQNKEVVEDAYKRVMRFAHLARREGLLALEYEAEFIPKEIPLCNELVEMISLVVSGTEPKIFEELMTIKFFAVSNYVGIDAVLYFLYARSMLMIQAAESFQTIEALFHALFPDERNHFNNEHRILEKEKEQKIKGLITDLTVVEKELLGNMSSKLQDLSEEEWKIIIGNNGFYGFDRILPYLDEVVKNLVKGYMNDYRYYVIMNSPRAVTKQELEELDRELEKVIIKMREKEESKSILDSIQNCSDEKIQLLLRNVDNLTLSLALKGASLEVTECFYRNLSLRLRYLIQEDMEYMGPVRISEVEEAAKKVIEVAKYLDIL